MTLSLPVLTILAGGKSSRMGGIDKALVMIGGHRMIDCVIERVRRQAGTIVIAGGEDRGTGLTVIPDRPSGPVGPSAALYSVGRWLHERKENVDAFFSVPVDAPFLPDNLLSRLSAKNRSAIAASGSDLHPTIGYWQLSVLEAAFQSLKDESNPSLRAVAAACRSEHIDFNPSDLTNINSMADLEHAEKQDRNEAD
ncbi:MAG: molybdenum cofactor guanylyltransferase [Pseudomonadota bacterium]